MPRFEHTVETFWSLAVGETADGCWLWRGHIEKPDGYGRVWFQGKRYRAHRLAYELTIGKIPQGLVTDHLCRVRHCVNPHHIEIVTNKENVLRGTGLSAWNARKSTCINGHKDRWGVAKSGRNRGKRYCRECSRLNCIVQRNKRKRNG